MMQYKFYLWPVLALTALVLACTNDDSVAIDAPALSKGYTYKLRLNMPRPGSTTRADYAWPNESKVEIRFTTADGTIDGTATYSTVEEEWATITTNAPLLAADGQSCKVRFLHPNADGLTPSFLTPTYVGNSKYACDAWQGDGTDVITIDTLTLKPATWRLRFQGSPKDTLSFFSDNIMDDQGITIKDTLTLTIPEEGSYTQYVYALFANPDGENAITVKVGGITFTRTVNGSNFATGKSTVLVVPTEDGAEGWESTSFTTAVNTPLSFEATSTTPQYIDVTSNEEWTATSDASWCIVNPEEGSNSGSVQVSVEENSSLSPRTATVTIKGKISGDTVPISITQSGVAQHTTASSTPLSFKADATDSPQTITVTSNEAWTATSSDGSWCIISPDEGTNNGTVTVTVTKATTSQSRNATVTITGTTSGDKTTVNVSREGIKLTTEPTTLTFEAKGSSQNVTVTCNTDWTASSNQTWCTVSPSFSSGDGTITVTAVENTSKDPHTATITVTAGTVTKTVTVTQKGKTAIDVNPFDDDENWDYE